jgi:DSF synthase
LTLEKIRQWHFINQGGFKMTQATTSFTLPQYRQLITHVDTERRAVWHYINPTPRPAFTKVVLEEIRDVQRRVKAHLGDDLDMDADIRYLVLASAVPRVYCLGGDLHLFSRVIRERDRETLTEYGRLCIDCVHGNASHVGVPGLTTISLVQGSALGGGFEAALSTNVLVAERSATFGFPEIIFNLFAGMGAYSLLSRRIDPIRADRMMRSGEQYSAEQLYDMGIVDVLAEDGEGVRAVNDYIRKHQRSYNGLTAIQQVRQRLFPLTYQELDDVVAIWVDAAMRLTDRDLRTMERLVAAQHRLAARTDGGNAAPEKVEKMEEHTEVAEVAGAA